MPQQQVQARVCCTAKEQLWLTVLALWEPRGLNPDAPERDERPALLNDGQGAECFVKSGHLSLARDS